MAKQRTGAREWSNIILKACRLSHNPGFKPALDAILGEIGASDVWGPWTGFCLAFETIVANDDFFNKKDATSPSPTGGEDDTGV
jgi:hypothetical protein